MTDENLFSDTNTANTLDQLVGEGKKFKTIEDLAKAKLESDAFIERLKQENAGIREDLNSRVRMEQLLERLEGSSNEDINRSGSNQNQSDDSDNSPDIETIIEQKLKKREAEQTAAQNLAAVKDALEKYFGSDYNTKIKARIADLGLNETELNALAKTSPKAFLKLVGVGEQRQDTSPYQAPTSKTNVPVTPTGGQRTYKYYSDLRKADPSTYWRPDVQLQLHKDAIAAANRGEDFYK